MLKTNTLLSLLLSLFLTMGLLPACQSAPSDERPLVTATIEPVRFVVEQIVGDYYRVQTLMPQGASPETYEPTPRQMMELNGSQALFRVGTLGFEQTKLPQLVKNTPQLPFVTLGRAVKPLVDLHHVHEGGSSIDPHVWMSPANLKLMAEEVCRVMQRLDSLHASAYRQRLERFQQQMDSLDYDLRQATLKLPQRAFLIYHPALGYFARDYGLEQLAIESNGKEPSVAGLQLLINRCKAKQVSHVFISAEHKGEAAKRLAEALHTQPTVINPLAYEVPEQLRFIAKELSR